MAAAFVGTWKMESSENFDSYMEAVGVGAAMAKIGSMSKPTVTISVDGDTWNMKSETLFKNSKLQFQIGVEFDETTPDDRQMKTIFTLEGNKLIQDQKGEKPSVITREVNGDKMTVLCTAGTVVATRIYSRSS
jgi:hypothetical protein